MKLFFMLCLFIEETDTDQPILGQRDGHEPGTEAEVEGLAELCKCIVYFIS